MTAAQRRARARSVSRATAPPVVVTNAESEPETLVVSHVFDVAAAGEPYSAIVRVSGRRLGVIGKVKIRDAFTQDETIEGIVPGSGPLSITTWIPNLLPGEWTVSTDLISGRQSARRGTVAVRPAAWSWRRWAIEPTAVRPIKTRWAMTAPLARQPAVLPGIYFALAVVGFALAMASQVAILASQGIAPGLPLAASLLAVVAGLTAARAWYALLHHGAVLMNGGWAVDGFLVVAPLVAVTALHALGQPIGTVLDAATPGIFWAVAIGRIGCFLVGCCAGRATSSRWAIWSSDRRVGARRVPAQLLEAMAGLVIGLVSLLLLASGAIPIVGAVFVGAFAGYAVIRQILLRLRAERRESRESLPLTAAASAAALLVVTTVESIHGALRP